HFGEYRILRPDGSDGWVEVFAAAECDSGRKFLSCSGTIGDAERSGMPIEFETSDNFGRLPRELELVIFRVVQEALTTSSVILSQSERAYESVGKRMGLR